MYIVYVNDNTKQMILTEIRFFFLKQLGSCGNRWFLIELKGMNVCRGKRKC